MKDVSIELQDIEDLLAASHFNIEQAIKLYPYAGFEDTEQNVRMALRLVRELIRIEDDGK